MIEQAHASPETDEWISGSDLWRVGFTLSGLPLICLMDGLVEILECVWVDQDRALVFIVQSKDLSGILFNGGELRAVRIHQYQRSRQGLVVKCPGISRTEYRC